MPATGRRRPRRLSDADLVKLLEGPDLALDAHGVAEVPRTGEQQTKTRTALRYYTRSG